MVTQGGAFAAGAALAYPGLWGETPLAFANGGAVTEAEGVGLVLSRLEWSLDRE